MTSSSAASRLGLVDKERQALSALLDSAAASIGHPAAVNNTVERITGHPARTLHDWTRENMADFVTLQEPSATG